jgi:hypothetical protein
MDLPSMNMLLSWDKKKKGGKNFSHIQIGKNCHNYMWDEEGIGGEYS